jgi:hypothetical protein
VARHRIRLLARPNIHLLPVGLRLAVATGRLLAGPVDGYAKPVRATCNTTAAAYPQAKPAGFNA